MARATVHDLANAAGVSLATIDRVLNRRGGVRPATIEKVEQAMARLNYRRDLAAAMLAKQREYQLVFLIPTGVNTFMRNLATEVARLADLNAAERVSIRVIEVPPFDDDTLALALNGLEGTPLTGVAVVATDNALVRQAIDRLSVRGVPVVTLVSDVPGSRRAHFVGIDNSAAGRTAASLMGRFLNGRKGRIAILAGSMLLRDHAERHFGFERVLRTEYPELAALPVIEGRDNAAVAEEVLGALLDAHSDIIGLYSLGAGNRGVIAALRKRGLGQKICVIAHELTDHSREALIEGTFDAILNQDPGHEARSAMRVLRALTDGQPIDPGQERIRIDIYLRDNLP
ncbi:transcriptional regulator [Labrys miyagiensis]|uniref:Transcriptional regulator n=1 Tax=Labrys miyagiensis TaxID=346912 RepID=A0ABQ6CHI5_9HYPH|nr:LacI family DNA-binding transcriptional regulator [Labrys miyagiensis]GLS17727.1 transcriptional regulator [Labrys miyagiensis]